MKGKNLFYALGEVDEKWLREADSFAVKKSTSIIAKRIILVAACFSLIVVSFVFLHGKNMSILFHDSKSIATSVPADIHSQAGIDGKSEGDFALPVLPAEKSIITIGEKITDEEAKSYLDANFDSITDSLAESGISTENAAFLQKGYSHVSFPEDESGKLTIKENRRDYLLYSADKLIAIVTLTKENNVISNEVSFGASWFDDFANYLESHKGQALIFAYSGMSELVIAPDNSVYQPVLCDYTEYFEDTDNIYSALYNQSDIYVP